MLRKNFNLEIWDKKQEKKIRNRVNNNSKKQRLRNIFNLGIRKNKDEK